MLVHPIYNPIPPLENNKLLTNDGTLLEWTDTPTVAGLISTGVIRATDFAKTGWPVVTGATFSFSYPTFTVTDGGSAYYYIDGVKYTLSGNHTVDITDTEGLWYIYFDGATLTASQTIWSFLDEDKALVAYLYWDAANNKEIFLGWEAHTFHMSGATHARLHYAGGARWETGLLVSATGNDVNISIGDIWDEELKISITDGAGSALFEQVLTPAELPIYYLDGASNWRIYETTDKADGASKTDVGYMDVSNVLKYNKLNGEWTNATVGLNNYVAYYVVATNEQTEPVALIMGQRFDNKLSDAKVNNVFGGLTLTGLPFEEMVVLARLILKDTATYELEEVLDLRMYNIKGNITSPLSPDHGGLAGLGDDDHVHYLLADGTRTLTNLILGDDPSVISSAYAIQIKTSGDEDDYLEFSTSSHIPSIKVIGSSGMVFESDNESAVHLDVREDGANRILMSWFKATDEGRILSTGPLNLVSNTDATDYIQLTTVDSVPIIGTVGTCDLKIAASSGEIILDDNTTINGTLDITGITTVASLVLTADPSIISSANEIQIKPSGDTANYLEFLTSGGEPVLNIVGEVNRTFQIQSSGTSIVVKLWEDGSHSMSLEWDKTNDKGIFRSTHSLELKTSTDWDDYISIDTVDGVPTIGTVGTCDLKITASSGEIDFDNENLTTLGNLTAANLLSDTWKSNDASKSAAWTSVAAGSLVLDGTGDYVEVDGITATANFDTGTFTGWFKLESGRQGDAGNYTIMSLERTADDDDIFFLSRSGDNTIRLRYRENDTVVTSETAEGADDTWVFVAGTWNTSGNLILYLGDPGGGAADTQDLSGRSAIVVQESNIGSRSGLAGNAQNWAGELSDIMIWDDDLSQAECEAIYDLGRNPTGAQVEALANYAELVSWWPFTEDATDYEESTDGTFVGNAYINPTAVDGLTLTKPLLVDNVLIVKDTLFVDNIKSATGDMNLAADGNVTVGTAGSATRYYNNHCIYDNTTASAANVQISGLGNHLVQRSTASSERYKTIDSDMTVEKAASILNLTPVKFFSKCKADDPKKVFYGLVAEDVAENYPEAAVLGTEGQIESYDINFIVAALIKQIQIQNEKIKKLEKKKVA